MFALGLQSQDLLQKQCETALALETGREHLQRVQASQGSRQMVQISVRMMTVAPRRDYKPQNSLNFDHKLRVNSILRLCMSCGGKKDRK